MKRVKILILIISIMIIPKTIYGLSTSISCTKTSLEVGETTNCTVSASGDESETTFTGTVTSNSNIEVIGGSLSFNINESQSFQIKALSEGTGTLTLTGDADNSLDIEILPLQNDDPNEPGNDDPSGNENNNTNQDPQNDQNDTDTENTSSDSTLKSLTISSGTINFSPSQLNYNVEISNDISNFNVEGVKNNSQATIQYSPSQSVSLKYGETKTISIIVSLQNGTSTTYKVTVTRKNSDDKQSTGNKSTDLKILTVEGVSFAFEPDKVSYNLTVPNEVEEVIISYQLYDSTSTATVDGDTKLKEGKNKIKIIVKASNGKTKTYTLNITRSKTRVNVINDEEQILEKINSTDKSDLYVNINFDDEKIISEQIIDALSKTQKELSYEVLNSNRELLYSITLNGKDIKNINEFNYQLSFISDNDDKLIDLIKSNKYVSLVFKNNSNIPGKIVLNVYVGDRGIKDYKKVNLYKFDGHKLKLVSKDVKINEGYAKVNIDENTEYVLTNLEKQKKHATSYTIPIIIILTLLVIIIIGLLIKKKKNKKIVENK